MPLVLIQVSTGVLGINSGQHDFYIAMIKKLNFSRNYLLRHLLAYKWSMVLMLIGFLTTITVAMSIPTYAEAVNQRVLMEGLTSEQDSIRTYRQPFDFVFRYVGAWHKPVSQSDWNRLNEYLDTSAAQTLGLQLDQQTLFLSTQTLPLFRDNDGEPGQRLERLKLTALSGFKEEITLVEGDFPESEKERTGQTQFIASLDLVNQTGMKVGESYYFTMTSSGTESNYSQKLTLVGIWLPKDLKSPYWQFYAPETLNTRLMVTPEAWLSVTSRLAYPVDEASWMLRFNGRSVKSGSVSALLSNIQRLRNQVSTLLNYTDLESSPVKALEWFQSQVRLLTNAIFMFSVPVFCLFLIFLFVISGILIHAQRNEIAVMRARGFSRTSILTRYLIQYLLLGLFAVGLGLPISLVIVRLIGRTKSFLDFSISNRLSPVMTGQSLLAGLIAMLVCVLICLIPVWNASQDTITSYKQENARSLKQPLWKGYFIDFGILSIALIGIYSISKAPDSITLARTSMNGLAFLLPFLIILGAALVCIRLLPFLLQWLAMGFSKGRVPAPIFITRQLSRAQNSYSGVLILLIITLALTTYTTSMAGSLDRNLIDGIRYEIGSDVSFSEGGEFIPGLSDPNTATDNQSSAQGVWSFIPVETYQEFRGVEAASRIGVYEAAFEAGIKTTTAKIFGLDRMTLPDVAFFRQDFADEHLIELMNRLAAFPDAVLIDRETWQKMGLQVGDPVEISLKVGTEPVLVKLTAVGFFGHFPAWDSSKTRSLFVANLDYLFESMGGLQPYKIWMRTSSTFDSETLTSQANRLGVSLRNVRVAESEIQKAFADPSRQGVLGILSIGFITSSLLAVICFALFSVSSLRNRAIQLGIFRAIGMDFRELQAVVRGELLFLIVIALMLGTALGWLTAVVLIPILPVSIGLESQLLPRVVSFDWVKVALVYAVYTLTLLLVSLGLMKVIRNMKLFAAIKLGETV